MMIGLCSGLFGKYRLMNRLFFVGLASVVLSVVTTLFSGVVTFYLFGGATGGTSSLVTASLYALGNSLIKSVFSVQFFQEIIDKGVSLFLVYGVLHVLPQRLVIKFGNGEVLLRDAL